MRAMGIHDQQLLIGFTAMGPLVEVLHPNKKEFTVSPSAIAHYPKLNLMGCLSSVVPSSSCEAK